MERCPQRTFWNDSNEQSLFCWSKITWTDQLSGQQDCASRWVSKPIELTYQNKEQRDQRGVFGKAGRADRCTGHVSIQMTSRRPNPLPTRHGGLLDLIIEINTPSLMHLVPFVFTNKTFLCDMVSHVGLPQDTVLVKFLRIDYFYVTSDP